VPKFSRLSFSLRFSDNNLGRFSSLVTFRCHPR
jgi:hypothetical protein